MNARRQFLAFVGGAAFSGTVQRLGSAEQPTLILPPRTILPAARLPETGTLLQRHETQLHAVLKVKQHMPPELFKAWLETGLRSAACYVDGVPA